MRLEGNKITRYITVFFGSFISGLYIYSAISVLKAEPILAWYQLIIFILFLVYAAIGELLAKKFDNSFFSATTPLFGMTIICVFEFLSVSLHGFDDLTLAVCIILAITVAGTWVLISLHAFQPSASYSELCGILAKVSLTVGCGLYTILAGIALFSSFYVGVPLLIVISFALTAYPIATIVDVWSIQNDPTAAVLSLKTKVKKCKSVSVKSSSSTVVFDRMIKKETLTVNDLKIAETLCNLAIISEQQYEELKQKYGLQLLDEQVEERPTEE